MTGEFAPESFSGVLLSGNAFNFLGVPPVAGRTIQPSDIRPDGSAEPVVVLSHRLWLRLFDGSPTAIGRTLTLNGRAAHDRRRDAAALRLVRQRRFLAAVSPDAHRPALDQSDHAAGARRVEASGRAAARRAQPAARAGEAGGVSGAGLHDQAAQLSRHHRRERRDADQPAAAARRGRVPAAHRLRQRGQPAAGARHARGRARWPSGCRSAPAAAGCCASC